MGPYVIRRILQLIPTLFLLTVLAFGFISLAPGDVVYALVDPAVAAKLGPEGIARQREALGLDKPIVVQYAVWLSNALQGDLGYSFLRKRPVSEMLGERLLATARLGLAALFLAVVVGVGAGIVSALKQYSPFDHTVSVLSFAAYSLPNFFLGLLAIYVFSVQLKWLPSAGAFTPGAPFSMTDYARHMILPASVLAVQFIGIYARQTRSAMLEVGRADHVRTARSKGLKPQSVVMKHTLRNALIPVITVIGLNLPLLITGAIVTEIVFSWPGIGSLTVDAIYGRDYPVVMGVVVIIGVTVMAANLLVDLCYGLVDPRIRYGEG